MEKPSSLVTRISDNSEGAEDDDLWAEDSDYGISDRQLQEITLGWRKHSRDKSDFDPGGSEGAGTWRTLLARLVQIPMCSSMCSALPCTGPGAKTAPRSSSRHKETVESISGSGNMSKQSVDEYLELVTKEEEVRFQQIPRLPPLQVEHHRLDKDNGEAVAELLISSP
eukprot:s2810_g2.t1